MARQRVGLATREQIEGIVEPFGDLRGGEHLDARGGEFDSKGQSIQATAEGGDNGGIVFVKRKSGQHLTGTFHKQADGITLADGRLIGIRGGQRQRWNLPDVFLGQVQWLEAGG
jgi:hypothetical protein